MTKSTYVICIYLPSGAELEYEATVDEDAMPKEDVAFLDAMIGTEIFSELQMLKRLATARRRRERVVP